MRKSILYLFIGIIVLIISATIGLIKVNRISNSYFANGQIEYIDPQVVGKSDSHNVRVAFIDKNGDKVIFNDLLNYASESKIGDSIEVIYKKEGSYNPQIYDSGYMWIPFILPLFISIGFLSKGLHFIINSKSNSKKRIQHKK